MKSGRGSSIGRTQVAHFSGTIARQREHEEKINKLKSINEVDALRGVFYSFFETGRGNGIDLGVDNTNGNKILISMQTTQH